MASIKILSTIVVFLAFALFWCWVAYSDADARNDDRATRWAASIGALVVFFLSVSITVDLLVIIWSM